MLENKSRLTRKYNEKCGIFSVVGADAASKDTYQGLLALQHRGQDSAGIISSATYSLRTGNAVIMHPWQGSGYVDQVFGQIPVSEYLQGDRALGHVRYTTSRSSSIDHCQPVLSPDGRFVLAHNGNIPNTRKLEALLSTFDISSKGMTDSGMMHAAIKAFKDRGLDLPEAVERASSSFDGAWAIVAMDKEYVVGARDKHGLKPLSLGKKGDAYVFSSETRAFDSQTTDLGDVEPGQMVMLSTRAGVQKARFAQPNPRPDIFEAIYLMKPDSKWEGKMVADIRSELGRQLAFEHPIVESNAVVIPVPDSGKLAGESYARTIGLPYLENAIVRNPDAGRTFISTEEGRRAAAEKKYEIDEAQVQGKLVVAIDDSIVRGTTGEVVVPKLLRNGAKGVIFLSASPEIRFPHLNGVVMEPDKLVSNLMSPRGYAQRIGALKVGYLSMEGTLRAVGRAREDTSLFCFEGEYLHDMDDQLSQTIQSLRKSLVTV